MVRDERKEKSEGERPALAGRCRGRCVSVAMARLDWTGERALSALSEWERASRARI